MNKPRRFWTDEKLHQELVTVCSELGRFPSNLDLQLARRGDLSNQIVKRGGFLEWGKKLGYERGNSESDIGWGGEKECKTILEDMGFIAEPTGLVRAPYDILVNGCVRIDVKTAGYKEYGPSKGWFYRNGKHTSADVLMLFQSDTKEVYYLPWSVCPVGNITISRDGGKYKQFRNCAMIIRQMVDQRSEELTGHRGMVEDRVAGSSKD